MDDTLLVCDKGSGDQDNKLVHIKLHYPCDVTVLEEHLSSPMSLTYMAETNADHICYFKLKDKVRIKGRGVDQ